MFKHSQKITLFALIVLAASCDIARTNNDDTFQSYVIGLPTQISPEIASHNTGSYILRQTHEPLFRQDKNSGFSSNILDNWSHNPDYSQYDFCLETKNFGDGQFFTNKELLPLIKTAATTFGRSFKIEAQGTCIHIDFSIPSRKFLNLLVNYEFAPSLQTTLPNVEIGAGPYTVIELGQKMITLQRKVPVQNGINRIEFIGLENPKAVTNWRKDAEDFNRVLPENQPEWIKRDFSKYSIPILQSIVLTINHPDPTTREFLFNCLDVQKLRLAFNPGHGDFENIKNLLPVGIVGHESGISEQNCSKFHGNQSKEKIVFMNWRKDNIETMQSFVNDFNKNFGNVIVLENRDIQYLIEHGLKSPHPYQLTVVAIDAVRPDGLVFFENLIEQPKRLIDVPLSQETSLYQRTIAEEDEEKELTLRSELLSAFKENHVVLPLFQETRDFYYPKRIKNVATGTDFLGYPEIGTLEL